MDLILWRTLVSTIVFSCTRHAGIVLGLSEERICVVALVTRAVEWPLSAQRVDLCKVSTYGFFPSSGKFIFCSLPSPEAAQRAVSNLQAKCGLCTRTAVTLPLQRIASVLYGNV
jgi:hypothetical protein